MLGAYTVITRLRLKAITAGHLKSRGKSISYRAREVLEHRLARKCMHFNRPLDNPLDLCDNKALEGKTYCALHQYSVPKRGVDGNADSDQTAPSHCAVPMGD